MWFFHSEGEGDPPDRVVLDVEGGELEHCRLEKVHVYCVGGEFREFAQDKMGWVAKGVGVCRHGWGCRLMVGACVGLGRVGGM